jgi:acyl-CoA synthetase (AMP-forming)/AMP-acid ligase II
LTYALFKLGAILVPLNPAFTSTQVTSALTHLDASYLFISTETNLPFKPPVSNIPLLTSILPDLHSTTAAHSEVIKSLKSVVIINNSTTYDATALKATVSYSDLINPGALSPQSLHANDIVNIQFTSGTTSTPKAASLTHTNILNNGFSIGSRLRLTSKDTVICPPPLFHCFGCVLGYMATATHGAAIGFPAESFDPKKSLAMVREEKASALYGVPTMFVAELELLAGNKNGLENLRTGIAAGSSIPATLMGKLHEQMNLTELTICYGMTETSPVSCMTTTDDPLEKRLDSVGRPLPHVDVKVVDPTNCIKMLNVGERGELAVSGYLVMKGYWGDEKRTNEVLKRDENGIIWMLVSTWMPLVL